MTEYEMRSLHFLESIDRRLAVLIGEKVQSANGTALPGTPAQVRVSETVVEAFNSGGLSADETKARRFQSRRNF